MRTLLCAQTTIHYVLTRMCGGTGVTCENIILSAYAKVDACSRKKTNRVLTRKLLHAHAKIFAFAFAHKSFSMATETIVPYRYCASSQYYYV